MFTGLIGSYTASHVIYIVVLWFGLVYNHILYDYFTGTGHPTTAQLKLLANVSHDYTGNLPATKIK